MQWSNLWWIPTSAVEYGEQSLVRACNKGEDLRKPTPNFRHSNASSPPASQSEIISSLLLWKQGSRFATERWRTRKHYWGTRAMGSANWARQWGTEHCGTLLLLASRPQMPKDDDEDDRENALISYSQSLDRVWEMVTILGQLTVRLFALGWGRNKHRGRVGRGFAQRLRRRCGGAWKLAFSLHTNIQGKKKSKRTLTSLKKVKDWSQVSTSITRIKDETVLFLIIKILKQTWREGTSTGSVYNSAKKCFNWQRTGSICAATNCWDWRWVWLWQTLYRMWRNGALHYSATKHPR